MKDRKRQSQEACPCSRGIDRREFIKLTAAAGVLAGCSRTADAPAPTPTQEPTATESPVPTVDPRHTEVPDLSDKRALYVLPRERYAVHCHESSAGVLAACGVGIATAALEKKGVAAWGTEAPPLMPDVAIDEVNVADFDAVIFECGQPLESDNPAYQQLAREAVRQRKVLGAVCMMPVLLAEAGLLEGKQATSNVKFLETLKAFGVDVDFYNDPVRDGNIITASFTSVEKFGWMVAEALGE